jgi:GNAT superfamily N-acetyltransferase
MLIGLIRHRRARRTDFEAIRALLTASGLAAPEPDRAGLRRFRRIVADLGADLYLAVADARVVGVVHVSYARHLDRGPQARLELLAVAPDVRRRGIGTGLAALVARRARRRGCAVLHCGTAGETDAGRDLLRRAGWRPAGQQFMLDLTEPAQ